MPTVATFDAQQTNPDGTKKNWFKSSLSGSAGCLEWWLEGDDNPVLKIRSDRRESVIITVDPQEFLAALEDAPYFVPARTIRARRSGWLVPSSLPTHDGSREKVQFRLLKGGKDGIQVRVPDESRRLILTIDPDELPALFDLRGRTNWATGHASAPDPYWDADAPVCETPSQEAQNLALKQITSRVVAPRGLA
jgi:hypothetical protein